MNRDQTGGFETAFKRFAEDCVKKLGCPLGTEHRARTPAAAQRPLQEASTPSPCRPATPAS